MRIAIEVASVSESQKQRSQTWTQRPGSILAYGEWRLSCRLCFLIIPSSGHPTHHCATLASAQRPSNPHSEYLEVVASHRRRCCNKMDLRLALSCKPPRSESVHIHYPSSPVVQRDRFPTSECGEVRVIQRIPRKSPETQQHLLPTRCPGGERRVVVMILYHAATRRRGWNGRTESIRSNPSINAPPLSEGHFGGNNLISVCQLTWKY